jgi:hypothetical protein
MMHLILATVLAVPPLNACASPGSLTETETVQPMPPAPELDIDTGLELELDRIAKDLQRIREHLEAEDPERDQVERVEAPSG